MEKEKNPADEPLKEIGWFQIAKSWGTLITGLVATIAAITSAMNKFSISKIEENVKNLELREKREKASVDFADTFITKVLPDPQLKDDEKHIQALLAILNIIAQASSSETGESNVSTRALLPMQLALILGQPGGLAIMDEDSKLRNDWIAMALADDSPKVHLTAIQALTGICQKALRGGRLEVVDEGIVAMDQLLALIPESKPTERASAVAARSQLASFLEKRNELLEKAHLPGNDSKAEEGVRSKIRLSLQDATTKAIEARSELASYAKRNAGNNAEETNAIKGSIDKIDAALKNARDLTVAQTQSGVDPIAAAIEKLSSQLTAADATKNKYAASQLALFGERAVKSLINIIAKTSADKSPGAESTRAAVAAAFDGMRQPVDLDPLDAYWVVSLLGAADVRARGSIVNFLIKLESDPAVMNCFDAMENVFFHLIESPEGINGTTVVNLASVLSAWKTNLTQDTPSRDGRPFPTFAADNAADWLEALQSSKRSSDWGQAKEILSARKSVRKVHSP